MTVESEFDAEMKAIMGDTPAPAPTGQDTPAPPVANSSTDKTYKAAGRDWKGDDLAKAHDSLVREFGKRNKDWEDLKSLREVKSNLDKDPEFNRYFRESIEAYQRARNAGQSQATAQRTTGLPPDVVQKLEQVDRLQNFADKLEFQQEENALVKKYKLDDDTLRKVEDYSVAHQGIPLEDAYKQMHFDLNQKTLADKREAEAQRRKEVSRAAAPAQEHIVPSARGINLKSDAAWRDAAGKELGKFFSNE